MAKQPEEITEEIIDQVNDNTDIVVEYLKLVLERLDTIIAKTGK